MSAINANNNLRMNNSDIAKTLEKLSSGFRVNRAADDSAGLAISEKMRGQIRGLNRASKNITDGISLLQTAEGGLDESHSVLQRMRELSVQASNGAYSDSDRAAIQKEMDQLANELDHISTHTNFNDIKLLDGSLSDGTTTVTSLDEALSTMTKDEFAIVYYGFDTTKVGSVPDTLVADPMYDSIRGVLQNEIVPNAVQSILDAYPAFYYLTGSSIGIGLELYRDDSSSTMAYVGMSIGGNSKVYTLGVNLKYADTDDDGVLDPARRTELEATIAHEMIHAFMDEAMANGMAGGDRFPGWFIEGMAQTAGGGMDWVASTGISASSSDATIADALSKLRVDDSAARYSYGYLASMYLGYMAAGGGAVTAENISYGLSQIMGSIISGKSLDQTIAEYTKYSGLSDFEDNIEYDSDAISFVRNLITASGSGRGSIVSGSLSEENLLPDAAMTMRLFELDPVNSKVTNTYPASVTIWSGGGKTTSGKPPVSDYKMPGRIGPMIIQVGANTNESVSISIERVNASSLGVSRVSVLSVENANSAVEAVDKAINKVSGIRATIGAMQNRLESALKNNNNASENLQSAESTIRDLDMAKGMMDYTKQSILAQAAQAMLAQANQLPQGVLQLLR